MGRLGATVRVSIVSQRPSHTAAHKKLRCLPDARGCEEESRWEDVERWGIMSDVGLER